MEAHTRLKSYLKAVLESAISERDLTGFVQLSRAIIEGYLGHVRASAIQLCEFHGLTITDLSFDCVADAFARADQDRFAKLERFARNLNVSLEGIEDLGLFLAYRSFLSKIADVQLAHLYAKADPIGARILRNLKSNLRRSNDFSLIRKSHGLICAPLGMESLDECVGFPLDELESALAARPVSVADIPGFLTALYDILAGQTTYRRSVLIFDLIPICKKILSLQFERCSEEDTRLQVDRLEEFELDRIGARVQQSVSEKIFTTYLITGKVTKREAEGLLRAFHDVINDVKTSGGYDPSLYEYLARYVPMNEETYHRDFYRKMTYLYEFVLSEFRTWLIDDM